MMVRILLVSVAVLVVLLTPVRDAQAVEQLSIGELALHCEHYSEDPNSKDGIFCTRYIQGFIDGAVATDQRVLLNVEAEYAMGAHCASVLRATQSFVLASPYR